jgi:hypothetical protein
MFREFRNLPYFVFGCTRAGPAGALLATGIIFVVLSASKAGASLIVLESPEFTLSIEAGAGASSDAPAEDSQVNESHSLLADGLPGEGTSTNASGSSGGGAGSPIQSAVHCKTDVLTDPALTGRLRGEAHLKMPVPPVRSLLRPPQRLQCMSA